MILQSHSLRQLIHCRYGVFHKLTAALLEETRRENRFRTPMQPAQSKKREARQALKEKKAGLALSMLEQG